MSDKQIVPVVPIWGGFGTGNAEQKLIECWNNSGITLTNGDVVVVNTAGAVVAGATGANGAVTTTTTASDPLTLGVISVTGDAQTNGTTIPQGGVMLVCYLGIARVNIGAATVAAAASISSAAVARQAAAVAASTGGTLGVALEANTAKDVNNTIRAFIKLS